MKFGTRTDIEAPQAFVFASLADFAAWERSGLRRGVELERTDRMRQPGQGMGWKASFPFRGRRRTMTIRVEELVEPRSLGFSGAGASVDGRLQADLIPMGPRRTRLTVQLEVKPRTLAARLYLQTLRLGRKRLEAKFADRIAHIALEIGERFRREG